MKQVKVYHIRTGTEDLSIPTELSASILEMQDHFDSKYGKGNWSWQTSRVTVENLMDDTIEVYQPVNPYIIRIKPASAVELGQSVTGQVYGHPRFLNGTDVFTSPVLAFTPNGFITKSHQYEVIKTVASS